MIQITIIGESELAFRRVLTPIVVWKEGEWVEAFYSTGLLFFVWPMVALTLLIDYIWVALCFGIALRAVNVQEWWATFKSRFFALFVTSFGADALLAGLMLAALAVAQLNTQWAVWLEHPFESTGGSLTALGCILTVVLCGLLKWMLYRNIVFKRLKGVERRQIQKLSLLLAILTTPWTFLLPTTTVGVWLGEMMIAIGGLAGSVSLESIGSTISIH